VPVRPWLYLLSAVTGLVGVLAATALATPPAAQTKREAEINVLRAFPHLRRARRMPDLVNPRTHLLRDNTEVICDHRGRRQPGNRFPRFVCVVRPHVHARRQGLYGRYRALSRKRFTIRWVVYRKR
jgi:hypothetical protein